MTSGPAGLDGERYSDGLLAGGGSDSWHSSVLRIAAEVPGTRGEFCVSCVYKRTKRNDFVFRWNFARQSQVVSSIMIVRLIDL